jgi:5-oxoprolinase (ATP-hydrolysing) subunit A
MRLDLNADVGESFGVYSIGQDVTLMAEITSANIACGFHAGDPSVMRLTVGLARDHGVAIGAHPGFPDLQGFGRRELRVAPRDVEDFVVYQVGALAAVAAVQGLKLQHVKPHGALYNMAARDAALADAIASAVARVDPNLILFGLSGSELIAAGRRAGLQTASEAFADRGYEPNLQLQPRGRPNAVIHDPGQVLARALMLAREHAVIATDGTRHTLDVDTVCVHGDTPGAAELAAEIRRALSQAGVTLKAVGQA